MKQILRLFSLLLIFSICIASVAFCGNSIVIGEDAAPVISEKTDGYVYGIFTEKYNISYKKDMNGNIIMSKEDLDELNTLSYDMLSIKKILNDKAFANKAQEKSATTVDVMQVANSLKKLNVASLDSERVVINATAENDSADNLTNYRSTLDIVKAYPLMEDGFILRVRFRWWWDYDPINTFTDKVMIAWSDELDNMYDVTLSDGTLIQSRFNYYQTGYPLVYNPSINAFEYDMNNPYKYTALALKGDDAITSVSPSCSYTKKFDIKNSFTYNGSSHTVFKHSGSMYVNVARGTVEGFDRIFNCHATYLHKKIALGDPSVSYTPGEGGGFTLSATGQIVYDKAEDAFDRKTYSEILGLMES